MGSLATLVQKAMAGPSSLIRKIEDSWKAEKVKLPLLKGGILRASEFGNVCPRQEVLCAIHAVLRKEEIDADSNMIFAHGNALHWALQNIVLPEIGVLVGRWSCTGCGEVYGGGESQIAITKVIKRPDHCVSCGSKQFLYRELTFYDEEHQIGGHPDGYLALPPLPGLGVIEAKSIMKGWEVKQCPIMGHVIQAQIYMWLTGLLWAKILYWEKGEQGVEALIEHHIERDDETIASIKSEIKGIWAGLRGGPLPTRICVKEDAPRAKKCCVQVQCFEAPNTPSTSDPL